MKIRLTKNVLLAVLLLALVALLWFPCAPKKITPATAYFGLGAVAGAVYAGYRGVKWILGKVKKPASKV